MEAKIREVIPKGVFTQESYEAVRNYFDEKEAELIRKYWEEHAEERNSFMSALNSKTESLKN